MGMNTAVRRSLRARLITRDGTLCHYCDIEMVVPFKHKTQDDAMTLEHIVPASYGGANDVSNMVLACHDCNNSRGNDLDFCWCERCKRVMENWFSHKFNSLINANKPRVKLYKGVWRVRTNKQTHSFVKWHDAIHYATTGEKNA